MFEGMLLTDVKNLTGSLQQLLRDELITNKYNQTNM